MRFLLLFLLFLVLECEGSSVFVIEEDDHTLSFPIQRGTLDQLQEDILNVLGIDYQPRKVNSPKSEDASLFYMQQLYSTRDNAPDESIDSKGAELVEAINPTERMLLEGSLWKISFSSSSISTQGELIGATLHFVPSQEIKDQITKVDVLVDIEGQLSLFSSWSPLTPSFPPINITSLLVTWRNSFAIPKIYLNILTDSGSPPAPTDWSVFIVGTFTSVPRVYKAPSSHRRTRRSIDDSPVRKSRKSNPFSGARVSACRKHGLYVDFNDLNWQSFVVSPRGFQAYYCAGACSFPLSSAMNATNHAIVQTLAHILDKRKTGESKCAPRNLLQQTVLFLTEEEGVKKVIMRHYADMIVEDCACQ